MPAAPSVAYATLTHQLPSKPYILGITPSSSGPHLFLRHPSSEITIADNQSLQPIDVLKGIHKGHITSVRAEEGAIWSAGKDGSIVRWDERSRRPGMDIRAFVRKPLPVLALAVSERDNLVIGGTELVSSEAHIMYWDNRHAKEPLYTHASTHSDDITSLSLLPPTSTYLPSSSSHPLPPRLLLSTSTDGLVALSNIKESDEEEAVIAAENWGQSIADAGMYSHKGKAKVWARSDMDGVAIWDMGKGEEEEIELQNLVEYETKSFREREFDPPKNGVAVVKTAAEERGEKSGSVKMDYLIDVVPSLGMSKKGIPMIGLGTNDGDIVLTHDSAKDFQPSAFFLSGPGSSRGHKDVVRSLYHDISNEAIYTGSEDGVLSGWSLASLPNRMMTGDPEIDDDGGDGREAIESEDEESEIETEESEGSGSMDIDSEAEEVERGPRSGPIFGRGAANDRKQKRKEKRAQPY